MGDSSLLIDYIDLVVKLPGSSSATVKKAVELFEEHSTYIELKPKIKKGALHINSNDAIQLLGYLDPKELSQFDAAKFKQLLLKELDQQLLRSTSLDKQAHYKWCMTAVKSFEVGRHLEDLDED